MRAAEQKLSRRRERDVCAEQKLSRQTERERERECVHVLGKQDLVLLQQYRDSLRLNKVWPLFFLGEKSR